MPRNTQQVREIIIAGTPLCVYLHENYLVKIDGLDIYLPPRLYKVTALLAMRRVTARKDKGWVQATDVFAGKLTQDYLQRSNQAITFAAKAAVRSGKICHSILDWRFYEPGNDFGHPGMFRLAADPDDTEISIGSDVNRIGDELIGLEAVKFLRVKR
jgi:hypothetical protein